MVFWCALAGLLISLTLLIYPYLIYPQLLRLLPAAPPLQPKHPPKSIALMFCARNEASVLPGTLTRLRQVKRAWPDLQIMAYDDASTDDTARLLQQARDCLEVTFGSRQVGKAAGLRRMLQRCEAEVVLFMDANILIMAEDLRRFRDYFADPTVGAVAARLLHTEGGEAVARIGGAYWRLEETLKLRESRTGSTMGCNGALWGMRRALYPIFDDAQSDDFRPSMEPLFHGFRVISAIDIRGVEVLETGIGQEVFRKARIACGAWHAHRAMRPMLRQMRRMDRWKYLSHKWMRWFSALWLGLAGIFAGVLAAQIGMLILYLGLILTGLSLAALGVRPFAQAGQIALAMVATLAGVILASMGRSRATWTPVRAK
ncbi:glycosyltransferase [Halovulum sp. GXIMD14793]